MLSIKVSMEIDQSNVKQTRLNSEVNRPIAFNKTCSSLLLTVSLLNINRRCSSLKFRFKSNEKYSVTLGIFYRFSTILRTFTSHSSIHRIAMLDSSISIQKRFTAFDAGNLIKRTNNLFINCQLRALNFRYMQ